MSLRSRLTLLYIALLLPALAAFSIVVYLIASRRLYGALDDSLTARMGAIDSVLPHDQPLTRLEVLTSLRSIDDNSASSGVSYRVLGIDGEPLFSSVAHTSRNLMDPEFPAVDDFRGRSGFLTSKRPGPGLRVSLAPLASPDGNTIGYLEGAASLKQTDDALDELKGVFVLGGFVILAATSAPAYVVAGRALRPVRDVSVVAREIEGTGDFSKRLLEPGWKGETSELVSTFNAMIGRVEQVLLGQKEFLADSSHELRRPLTVMRTYIDLLRDPALPEAERKAWLQEMHKEAEAMSKLIADLLLLAREGEQSLRHEEVNLSDICARMTSDLERNDGQHRLTIQAERDVMVVGDREKLEELVTNLLENAAQNTPRNGAIEVRVERANGNARIEVRDSGRGIAAEDQPYIFDRFYRGGEARASRSEGVGLGLAIVKHVADIHRGSVTFQSQVGKGSDFVVEIPAVASASDAT